VVAMVKPQGKLEMMNTPIVDPTRLLNLKMMIRVVQGEVMETIIIIVIIVMPANLVEVPRAGMQMKVRIKISQILVKSNFVHLLMLIHMSLRDKE
jgi:hypothetical protein